MSEAAKTLGYSKNSIYSFLKDGLIKSVRIGKGKFRIPEKEIKKFEVSRGSKVESLEEKTEITAADPTVPASALLPIPRPGKSLSELSGESVLHVIKLWLEERVGFPALFDWLTSLMSIIVVAP